MKKYLFLGLFCLLNMSVSLMAGDVLGFWKTINDKTGKAECIVGIYEHQGLYYGRIIATYGLDEKIEDTMSDPKKRAPGVEGEPFYSGMDIMWDLKKEGSKYVGGKILDPEKGKIYNSEMWPKDNNLIVRGQIWIFGQNEEWVPALDHDFPPGFLKPDLTKFTPLIPHVKKRHVDMHSHESKGKSN